MKILKTILGGVLILSLTMGLAYAEGKGKGHEEKTHGQKENQSNERASGVSANPETRRHITEKGRNDATIRATRPDTGQSVIRANQVSRIERGKNAERSAEKKGKELVDALVKAEKARWSYNPHDTRGQGNMGKPRMRDPYGFDKDSGREKSERGRPIREVEEALLNLADIINIDFTITDYFLSYLQDMIEQYKWLMADAQQHGVYDAYLSDIVAYYESLLNAFVSTSATGIPVEDRTTIDYTLTFTSPNGFEGTTLLVTTTLTSVNDYTSWTADGPHYDADQVVMEQTQEVVLGTDNTLSFSYDPPYELAGTDGFYADLAVTVTEPVSGTTYTQTYDKYLYLWRCPYGKVYNAKTGTPVVGAKITVHFEDGFIVPLDKASNPTANNPQTTDATGRYEVKLETNRKYYITATAPRYKEYKSPVFTEKWHVLREDIALEPLEELASK